MKQIPLTKGKYALVDDEDYHRLNQWKWCYLETRTGYAVRHKPGDNKALIYMHRVIMNTPPNMVTDHRNNNSLDNRKNNLRVCTQYQNSQNRKKYRPSASMFRGVTKHGNTWRPRLKFDGKDSYIGDFHEEHHAALAYDLWMVDLHGEFANPNFPVVAHS